MPPPGMRNRRKFNPKTKKRPSKLRKNAGPSPKDGTLAKHLVRARFDPKAATSVEQSVVEILKRLRKQKRKSA